MELALTLSLAAAARDRASKRCGSGQLSPELCTGHKGETQIGKESPNKTH